MIHYPSFFSINYRCMMHGSSTTNPFIQTSLMVDPSLGIDATSACCACSGGVFGRPCEQRTTGDAALRPPWKICEIWGYEMVWLRMKWGSVSNKTTKMHSPRHPYLMEEWNHELYTPQLILLCESTKNDGFEICLYINVYICIYGLS